MKYYRPKGWGFRPNYIIQYPDTSGADRSIPFQFSDTARDLALMSKVKGFWRVKYKEIT